MWTPTLSPLVSGLSAFFKNRLLEEKRLIAPNMRVGHQWLDWASASGAPVFNVRVATMAGLVLELASPAMNRDGLSYLSGLSAEIMLSRLFDGLSLPADSYLGGLARGEALRRSLLRTVTDLRLSGARVEALLPGCFEVPEKGREIRRIVEAYEKELEQGKWVDYAGALKLAAQNPGSLKTLLVIPSLHLERFSGLEREFWESLPRDCRAVVDPAPVEDDGTDRWLMGRWLGGSTPGRDARGDGTVEVFRAIGEVNEAREIFRRCASRGVPLDEVEIVHTDYETYVPLLYELASLMAGEDGEEPATFSEGIPARYSRPGRALKALLSWIGEDYPQAAMTRIIGEGLLNIDAVSEGRAGYAFLAAVFRSVPVGGGRARYLEALDRERTSLANRLKRLIKRDDVEEADKAARIKERIAGVESLAEVISAVFDSFPERADGKALAAGARRFLDKQARSVGRIDEYSLHALRRRLDEMDRCLEDDDSAVEVLAWLSGLPDEARVGGLGPAPGKVHVAPYFAGGQSGRPYTFVVGLDDSRFPGAGSQDPLLLDGERAKISGDLVTGAARVSRHGRDLKALLGGITGSVTLSWSCRSLDDDREMFPAGIIQDLCRLVTGKPGALDDLAQWAGPPRSFASASGEESLDASGWWLAALTGKPAPANGRQLVRAAYPHLGRGMDAARARASDLFTEYDGYVPEAGADCDPAKPGGHAISATALEKMAACPLEYFFRHVLKIEPVLDFEIDRDRWLDPAEKGGLLHEVFHDFMSELTANGLLPDRLRDRGLLNAILEEKIKNAVREYPPPSDMVFEREVRELRLMCSIFLAHEEEHCRSYKPLWFEAALGVFQNTTPTTLDAGSPAFINLPSGRKIRARGRIDRIDEGADGFYLWDYKTGGAYKYHQSPPFYGGRTIQSAFYAGLCESALKKARPGARIAGCGYFFPTEAAHGERILVSPAELREGLAIVDKLCGMIASGCFPPSDDPDDYGYSDYLPAVGELDKVLDQIKAKMDNPSNQALESFAILRGRRS